MRLLNLCPFKVGDVVYWEEEPDHHTKIIRIEMKAHYRMLFFWNERYRREDYWYVCCKDPNHSGIRLLKRGDE